MRKSFIALLFEDMVKLIRKIIRHSFRAEPFIRRAKGRWFCVLARQEYWQQAGQDGILPCTTFEGISTILIEA
jgi:hypothetical protein